MTRKISFLVCALAAVCATPAFAFFTFPETTDVQEYVNDITGHYFLVAESSEKLFIDSGQAGPGWHATGYEFSAYLSGSLPATGSHPGVDVCRFYAPSPNTHFFTASVDECQLLRAHPDWGWIYEGVHFRASVPVNGACVGSDSKPIHRLYNNRFQFNDSNHRFVFDDGVRADMVARGWSDEGVVFCSSVVSLRPAQSFTVQPKDIRPADDCTNEDVNLGSCIGMSGLSASLPNQVVSWVPPFFVTRGPFWSPAFGDLTGSYDEDVYTAQPANDTAAILAHSFVQERSFISPNIGAHVTSADALSALASIEPIYQFSTRAPAQGAADRRVFPWRAPRENHLDLSFLAWVKTAHRADAQSHAYGGPMIEFRDVVSGGAIDVTVATFATFPAGDFVGGKGPVTGNVFVSTSFYANTLFGTRLSGDFIPLGETVSAPPTQFAFRMTPGDFAKVVQLARGSNPALSPDVKDYMLVNLRFRNGILGNAELGATIANLGISLFGY